MRTTGTRLGSNQSQRSQIQQQEQLQQNTSQSSTTVESNISKALQKQNQSQISNQQQPVNDEVSIFLNEVGLIKYREQFIENGIEDLEIILELDDKHLEQMNVPLGHKLKILKRIKDLRRD